MKIKPFNTNTHLFLLIILAVGFTSCAEQFREIHGSEHAGNAVVVGNWGQAQSVNARVIRKNKDVIVHHQKELLDTVSVQPLLNESRESNPLSLMDDQKTLNSAIKTLKISSINDSQKYRNPFENKGIENNLKPYLNKDFNKPIIAEKRTTHKKNQTSNQNKWYSSFSKYYHKVKNAAVNFEFWPSSDSEVVNWIFTIGFMALILGILFLFSLFAFALSASSIGDAILFGLLVTILGSPLIFLWNWLIRTIFSEIDLDQHSGFFKFSMYGFIIGLYTGITLFIFAPLFLLAIIYDLIFF